MDTNFGMTLALAAHGMSHAEFNYCTNFVDSVEADPAGVLHKQAAALAAHFYKQAGREDALAYHLYNNLADPATPWSPGYVPLVVPIYTALDQNDPFRKEAMSGAIGSVMNGLKGAPSAWQKMLLAAGVVGAGAGGLAWQMQQDTPEEDAEAASTQAQIEFLNNITHDIDTDLRRRGVRA
jgi:hypothetical protein